MQVIQEERATAVAVVILVGRVVVRHVVGVAISPPLLAHRRLQLRQGRRAIRRQHTRERLTVGLSTLPTIVDRRLEHLNKLSDSKTLRQIGSWLDIEIGRVAAKMIGAARLRILQYLDRKRRARSRLVIALLARRQRNPTKVVLNHLIVGVEVALHGLRGSVPLLRAIGIDNGVLRLRILLLAAKRRAAFRQRDLVIGDGSASGKLEYVRARKAT